MSQLYDRIGAGYAARRRPDARIAGAIRAAIGDARRVVNVGAGAGSYEPVDRSLIAVEPSLTMIAQRRSPAPVVRASAGDLPFRTAAFDVALALLTLHHWPDQERGLRELRRVGARVVLLTFEPDAAPFWLTRDYFPAIAAHDRHIFPSYERMRSLLGAIDITPLLIAHDCSDGFLGAYWRRPSEYLDAGARAAISSFANLPALDVGLARLRADLADGTWMQRNGELLRRDELDLGYRLVVTR